MAKFLNVTVFVACLLGALAFGPREASAQVTGYVQQVRLVPQTATTNYLYVQLSTSISGGTAMNICTITAGPQTYGIYYANDSRGDAYLESIRALLMSAFLAGRQVTITAPAYPSTGTSYDCRITDVRINS